MNHNFLHLDFKGVVPAVGRLMEYLDYFKACGFNGVIFEIDCRYQWRTWPDAAIPLLTKDDIKNLVEHCEKQGMRAIPLVQIQGHLEWVLKHDHFAHLRENDFFNELCPSLPESGKRVREWIDEALELFSGTEYIHLGGDETWNYASCPACTEYADKSKHGKFGVYIDHVAACCRHALGRGVRPLIWADMFWREKSFDLVRELPEATILIDWQYTGKAPFGTTFELMKTGYEVWGASAISCGWYEGRHSAQREPGPRFDNILSWYDWGHKNDVSIIHTTWGRPGNLWNLYPPWTGQLPFFIAAGNPDRWQHHPWREFFTGLNDIMFRGWPHELEQAIKDLESLPAADDWERECLQWWILALRYQVMFKEYLFCTVDRRCVLETEKFVGRDPHVFNKNFEVPLTEFPGKLTGWEREVREFWDRNQLSDRDEFIAEKKAVFQFD